MRSYGPRIIGELDVGWQTDAACRDADPEAFFDEHRTAEALAVCACCPVVEACRAFAAEIRAEVGVFAGQVRSTSTTRREQAARRAQVARDGRNRHRR